MKWAVASPYFETARDKWISDAIDDSRHDFALIPRIGDDRHWHQANAKADFGEWRDRYEQARMAFRVGQGVITVFPQLAVAAGLHKGVFRAKRHPLVAWMFNTDGFTSSTKRWGGHAALRNVDTFVVHSTREISGYASLLGMPVEKFDFVPLQYGGVVEFDQPEGQEEPYVFATGSGHRDYKTFFDAVGKLGYRTLVLASDHVLAGLDIPSNVTILEQISRPEIRRLVRHARVNVVPMTDYGMTAGLVTIVETYRHGRSLVITDRPGIDDYVFDQKNALCSPVANAPSMATAIEGMWTDEALRSELDAEALRFANDHCTDEAAGRHLIRVLDALS